jgi:hypothetical protein
MYKLDTAPNWINQLFPPDYPRSFYDSNRNYTQDTVFYYDHYGPYHDTIVDKLDRGHQIIYDDKNEHYIPLTYKWIVKEFMQHPGQGMFLISGHKPQTIPGVTIQATPYWYWILEQMTYRDFGYHTFVPEPTNQHKFFMQIQNDRPDRDALYEKLKPVLHDSLHSYRNRGVYLPNDRYGFGNWQRYMNFDWINQTCFSLTVETYMDDGLENVGESLTECDSWFLSEKSYKAIAAHHPFILAGTHSNLSYLRSQGFETFPELWDESYDNERDFQRRINLIADIVIKFDKSSFNQNIVKQKLEHNRARFFDKELTKKFWQETVLEPILKFVQ